MKKALMIKTLLKYLLVSFCMCLHQRAFFKDAPVVIDQVVAFVGCGANKKIICQSEVGGVDFYSNLKPISFDELLEKKMLLCQAENFKMGTTNPIKVSPSEIEARMERVKSFLGVPGANDKILKEALSKIGLELEQAREQIYQMAMVEHLKGFLFPEKNTPVSSKKIREYFDKNPKYEDSSVKISVAEVAEEENSEKNNRKLNFTDLGWIKVSDFNAEDKEVIDKLSIGQVSEKIKSTGNKFRFIKLLGRKDGLIPLEERKAEISEILETTERKKKYEDYVASLKKTLHVKIFKLF